MTKFKKATSGLCATAAMLLFATSASALTVVKIIVPTYPGTVTGTTAYAANELLSYKFTIAAPYRFSFTATGSGGTFPFPIGFSVSGAAGTYTEQYAQLPVSGTVSYSLTTAVPEPSMWMLLLTGFGLVGGSIRRRTVAVAV